MREIFLFDRVWDDEQSESVPHPPGCQNKPSVVDLQSIAEYIPYRIERWAMEYSKFDDAALHT